MEALQKIITKGLEFIGRYYSIYKGIVVDTEDPDNMGALSVIVPRVTGTSPHPKRALPKTTWGGKNYGINFTPSKGDLVWVEFEYGNPKFPVWSPGGYALNEKPKEFKDNTYGYITPEGHSILIEEESNTITIKHSGGNSILLKDTEIFIKGNSIRIEGKSIPTLPGPFCAIGNCLYTGAPHTGNIANN